MKQSDLTDKNANDTQEEKQQSFALVVRDQRNKLMKKGQTLEEYPILVQYEKLDETYYSFSCDVDSSIKIRMDESERYKDQSEFVDAEFQDYILESERLYYLVAASSGLLTGAISAAHISFESLEKASNWEKRNGTST